MDKCNDYPYLNGDGYEACFLLNSEFQTQDITPSSGFKFEIEASQPMKDHIGENSVGTMTIKVSWQPKGDAQRREIRMERVVPMLAAGSNASPKQLRQKFQKWKLREGAEDFTPVFCARVTLRGICPAYSAHAAPYGAIPLTLVPSGDDARYAMSLLFIAEELVPVMNRSESLGINYCLALWTDKSEDLDMQSSFDVRVPWAYTYLSRHGYLHAGSGDDGVDSGTNKPLVYQQGTASVSKTVEVRTQAALRTRLRDALLQDTRVKSLVDDFHASAKSPPDQKSPAMDDAAIEALLKKGSAVTAISNALKAMGHDLIPDSMQIVAGSNGYAEFLQRRGNQGRGDFNVIPSGERTFSSGRLIVFLSPAGAKLMRGRPVSADTGTCVLLSFHPLSRQEIAVLAHFEVRPYDADQVRIYGRETALRVEPPMRRRRRLALRSGRHPDLALRNYHSKYEEGTLCIAPQSIRGALGYAFDDTEVVCHFAWVHVPKAKQRADTMGRAFMGWQESYARIAKLPIEDMEKSICRIQTSMMDILGVQPGYNIVIDSVVRQADKYVLKTRRIRALVCSSEHISVREKSPGYGDKLTSRYVNSQANLGVPDAHPILMLDRSIRTDLLQNDEDCSYPDEVPGAYLQSLRIRRSNLGLLQKELMVVAFSFFGLWFGITSVWNQTFRSHPVLSICVGAVCAGFVVLAMQYVRHRRWPERFRGLEED